ncbi:MAG: thioredoxin domain-containing protein [Pseudomonadota bacterium]
MKPLFLIVIATLSIGAAPPAPNWTSKVNLAPNGAFVMGNPAAKAKLVEYLSYTCSHCAEFNVEAAAPLKRDYVAKGLVSVEFRNAVRDRLDFTAALIARCGGPRQFFAISDQLMATQSVWLGKAQTFAEANGEKLEKMPINEGLKLIARGLGFDMILKARGITPVDMDACLTNKAAQDKIAGMTNEAWGSRKIQGTPSFLINDSIVTAPGKWALIEPELKTALAAKK